MGRQKKLFPYTTYDSVIMQSHLYAINNYIFGLVIVINYFSRQLCSALATMDTAPKRGVRGTSFRAIPRSIKNDLSTERSQV